MVHSDDEAFEGAPGNTLHPLVNTKPKDGLMDTTNELEETDDSSGQGKNNETLMGTRSEPIENMGHPAAGIESVQEDGKVISDKNRIQKPLKDTGQADDDDMERTFEDGDTEEVKPDIEARFFF